MRIEVNSGVSELFRPGTIGVKVLTEKCIMLLHKDGSDVWKFLIKAIRLEE